MNGLPCQCKKVSLLVTAFLAFLFAACATPPVVPIADYDHGRSALLLIDFQKDFLQPDGKMPVATEQARIVVQNANKLQAWAKGQGMLVIMVGSEFGKSDLLNIFRNNAAIEGSQGAELDERLVGSDASQYFAKAESDAFSNPALEKYLVESEVNQLFIAGMYAEFCILYTTKAALDRKYRTTVVSDALASKTAADLANALRQYRALETNMATTRELIEGQFE